MKSVKWMKAMVLAAMVALPVSEMMAQRLDYRLWEAPWFLKHSVGQKTLQQSWVVDSGMTQADVETNLYPKLFERLNALGWHDTIVMKMNVGPAAHNEAMLMGHGGGQPITGRITSNNGVYWPEGVYAMNFPAIVDGGECIGKGTGYAGAIGGAANMNTTLQLNRTGWLGGVRVDGQYQASGNVTTNITFDSMNMIQSTTWQMLSGSNSYSESGVIDGFRLVGDNGSWYISSYTSHGLATWDLGETYRIGRIYAETFNGYGWACVRGTPATTGEISCFQNALGGVGLLGTELNTININTLSGDDNPAMIVMRSGYGRGSGGTISVQLVKSESGKRTPNKGQIILWQRDPSYGNITIDIAQGDMTNLFVDAMFVINNNVSSLGQIVSVQFRAWNYRTTFHDVTNQVRWASQVYRPYCLVYTYRQGQSSLLDCSTGQLLPSTAVNATDRLGMVANNGTFDYANGLPLYDIYGGGGPPPPTPTCVWVVGPYGPFGPCVSNQQTRTRTVVSSEAGCTPVEPMPADSETQACNVTPPPTAALYTREPANNSSVSTSIDIPNVLFKRIVLTGVTFTDPTFNYQRLIVEAGGTAGVRMVPQNTAATQGRFRSPTGQYATMTTTPVVTGVYYPSLEIVFNTAITSDRLFAVPGTGSAIRMTCTKLELFAQ